MNDTSAADLGLLAPYWAGSRAEAATSDAAVLQAILDAEEGLLRARVDLGAAPESAALALEQAADPAAFDLRALAVRARFSGNPVIPLVDDLRAAVGRIDPDAVPHVHLGATSQDIVDTALVLVVHRAVTGILEAARAAGDSLAVLADQHRVTVMAGRASTQHSVPITFGLKAARWLGAMDDGMDDLARVIKRLPVQLGGAAGTLAGFDEGRDPVDPAALMVAYADRLGLGAPDRPWHTERRRLTAVGDALGALADAVGTIATDVGILSRPEIGEVTEPHRTADAGMPERKIPIMSVLMRASTLQVPWAVAQLHGSAITEDERPDGSWHAEWVPLRALLRLVGGATELAAELTAGLQINTARMAENLEADGPLIADRLLTVLGPEIGEERITAIVTADDGRSLRDRLMSVPELAKWRDRLDALLSPRNYLGDTDRLITASLAHHQRTRRL
ncbi:MAG TPA: lyase family protein [Naasia sp.]